jgi:hypothetical protein
MSDLELEVADSLERIFPVPVVVADWDDVLDRADAGPRRGASSPPRVRWSPRRRRFLLAIVAAAVVVGVAGSAFPRFFATPYAERRLSRTVDGIRFSLNVPQTKSINLKWENGPIERISDGVAPRFQPEFRVHDWLIAKSTEGGQAAEALIFWAGLEGGGVVAPCVGVLPSTANRSLDGLADAVASAPGTKLAGGPWRVTVGGRAARRIVLRVQKNLGCQPGFLFTWPHDPPSFWWGAFWPNTDVGDSIRVWIVDVGGKRLFFEALTKPAHGIEQEIGGIIRSIRFG